MVWQGVHDRALPATCTLPSNFLNEGLYSVNAIVLTDITQVEIFAREAVSFTVYDTGAMRKEYSGIWIGVVRPRLAWQTENLRLPNTVNHKENNP